MATLNFKSLYVTEPFHTLSQSSFLRALVLGLAAAFLSCDFNSAASTQSSPEEIALERDPTRGVLDANPSDTESQSLNLGQPFLVRGVVQPMGGVVGGAAVRNYGNFETGEYAQLGRIKSFLKKNNKQ
jgi:hypothetical protein